MASTSMSSGTLDPAHRTGRLPASPAWVRLGDTTVSAVGTARVYVCGITPYDVTHLGHAATFVWADVLSSVLESTGLATSVCRNVTDVDDVLTAAAAERGRHYDELALLQEGVFDQSMRALRVATPTHQPRARHHVDAVVQLAAALLESGAAYERDGTVWFRGRDVLDRAGLAREEALSLSREYGDDPDATDKDDPFDVPVWQPSPADHPAWSSPWGWGRPGWHAECAAMALAIHGAAVDVLVGGEDLRFPHHAYQSAMVEAASGVRPFQRAALHVGEVRVGGQKMAKSTGNLVLVDDVLASHSPAALRTLLIDRRHDEPWNYREDDLAAAQSRLERLYAAAGRAGDQDGDDRVVAPLRDGLDVPTALDRAEEVGGGPARRLLALLRLG
ncbi:hypothetical protein KUV85_06590 [Nocardioides panacisoli]|uniref:hypothetical protein n=1 Tax=Nocardioides panacisoli TaxID=627624 RepID=UPI001C625F55|nr:hypothetical protein [Nocardioides panacisoli]QYJ05341.1 hypothetical protein KUV85_06590 [Nocardioides panacisoli]